MMFSTSGNRGIGELPPRLARRSDMPSSCSRLGRNFIIINLWIMIASWLRPTSNYSVGVYMANRQSISSPLSAEMGVLPTQLRHIRRADAR